MSFFPSRMREGLRWSGMLSLILKYPRRCAELLTVKRQEVTADLVKCLFRVKHSSDADKKKREEKALTTFHMYLEDCEGTSKMSDFLQFATGKRRIPLLGYELTPEIDFRHPEDVALADHTRDMPRSMACFNKLSLPTGLNFIQLYNILDAVFLECHKTFSMS